MTWTLLEEQETGLHPPQLQPAQMNTPQAREPKIPENIPYQVADKTPNEIRAMSLPEKMQYMQDLQTQREYLSSAGFVKGALSGATFGATENIEALKPQEYEDLVGTGKFAGSMLPISKLLRFFGGPLVSLASKSPIFQKQLTSLANLTGAALAGGAYEAGESLAKGELPSTDDMIEHGAEWALLDGALQAAGTTGRFVSNLIRKSKTTRKPAFQLLNETVEKLPKTGTENIAEKAMEILEQEPAFSLKDLKEKRIEPQVLDRLTKETESLSAPYQPKEFKFEEIEKSFPEIEDVRLDKIAPRAESEKVLGENIQKDIESRFEEAKQTYEPLYKLVEEQAENIKYTPKKTIDVAKNTLRELESLKTKPEGYQKVISTLESSLEDLGIKPVSTRGFEGLRIQEPIPLQGLMELGRRLNKIIDYDVVGSSIKDKLKPLVRSVKQDIRQALQEKSPNLSQVFDAAERQYGEAAAKFGKEPITKIREQGLPEKIAGALNYPTAIQDLKSVLSTEQIAQVEREVLSKLNSLPHNKAQGYYREVANQLSPESRKLASDLIREKHPGSKDAQAIKKIESGVLGDLNRSINSGKRPEKTLNLMKTQKGNRIVENALKDNPNKQELMNYLRDQSLYDFSSSILDKEGKIDFKKLKEYLKDQATVDNIKSMGGHEAVAFLQNLESMSKSLERNLKLLEKLPAKPEGAAYGKERLQKMARKEMPIKFKLKDLSENLGIPTKTLLTVTGGLAFALPKTVLTGLAARILYKFVTNRKTQLAFKRAASQRINPKSLLQAFEQFDKSVEEETPQAMTNSKAPTNGKKEAVWVFE